MMTAMLLIIGLPVSVIFVASAISFAQEGTKWSLVQLIGAAGLVIVVPSHIAEVFHLLA